ncbi:MAG: hypothetical protein E7409_04220 [Ruminococcaceae bacterium]|nr:hypothetical protein [Oscillospiraceae bacterium]
MSSACLLQMVLRCSAQGTLVGLVVLAVRALLGRHIAAKWRMLLWGVMLVRFVLPFYPQSGWSLFGLVPSAGELMPATVTMTPDMATEQVLVTNALSWHQIAFWVWAIGAGISVLWVTAMQAMLHWNVHRSKMPVSAESAEVFARARQRMGASERIVPMVQTAVTSPALMGVVRPKVLITPQTEQMSVKSREMIFMHEIAHHCRGDALLNHLLLLIGCVHWFNPVLWGLLCPVRRDMEQAADQKVLRHMSSIEHGIYGQTIIAVLGSMAEGRMRRVLSLTGDRSGIRGRLKEIARYRTPALWWSAASVVCVGVMAVICLTSAPEQPQEGMVHTEWSTEVVAQPQPTPTDQPVETPIATLRVEKAADQSEEKPTEPTPQPDPTPESEPDPPARKPPKVIMPNLSGEYLEGVVDMLYAEVEQDVGVHDVVQMLEQSGKTGGNDLKNGYVYGEYRFADGSSRTVEGVAPDENGIITLFASGSAPHMANVCFTPAGEAMPAAEYGVLADDRAFSFTGFDPNKRYDITISAATRDEWKIDGEFVVY